MDAKEFSKLINNRQYGYEITQEEIELALDNGLIIVFGQSDDLIELEGAISDEVPCFDGGSFYISKDLKLVQKGQGIEIEAKWCEKIENEPNIVSWVIKTDIPHYKFNVLDDDDLFCIGIVFHKIDLLTMFI